MFDLPPRRNADALHRHGLHTDLDEAAKLATLEMIDFLATEKGMKRHDAYILCSIGVDLHVTELVDGTKVVRF